MTTQELANVIAIAAGNAFADLFSQYPNDTFYYCSLITTGEGHTPRITAWSKEKLEEAVKLEGGSSKLTAELKWSYADSPFYCFGESHFDLVEELFTYRSDSGDTDSTANKCELGLRLQAMATAMAALDAEGLFGTGAERLQIVVNAEVMPPDHSNVERARRLNPPEALKTWLNEAAER